MSPLSDLFIATPEEVNDLSSEEIPSQMFEAIDIKGIEMVKLAKLAEIVLEIEFAEALQHLSFVRNSSEDGPWIINVPNSLRDALASLDDRISVVASKWAETEEFQLDNWDESQVASVLEDMCELATKAVAENKRLYNWVSL